MSLNHCTILPNNDIIMSCHVLFVNKHLHERKVRILIQGEPGCYRDTTKGQIFANKVSRIHV